MKNTKYLFKDGASPGGMVSVSQLQSFLSCRKKWEYGYIENLTPRVDRAYLTIGKLCHKGMQAAMQSMWADQSTEMTDDYTTLGRWKAWRFAGIKAIQSEWDTYLNETDLLTEEIPDLQQMLSDAVSVFTQAFEEFEPWKYEIVSVWKNGKPLPALELHFKVPCPPTAGLHGFIDAILTDRETGFTWCVDYKFRKSLSPDEDEATNIQNAVYAYACGKMGIEISGTMTWQHLNTPAATPAVLKDGKISRTKIKTTWKRYEAFCREQGQDPAEYTEMQEKLAEIEWYRATLEYRNNETIQRIWDLCVLPVAKKVKAAHGAKADNFRSLYPWNCKMCQYQSICQAELRGYDAEYIRMNEYTKKGHAREDNKPIDS